VGQGKARVEVKEGIVILAWCVVMLGYLTLISYVASGIGEAHANAPGTKWGDQIEVGTVGNCTVIKVNDDGLICFVLQPRGGGTPAFNCWGSP
jgi:hypothetical protein